MKYRTPKENSKYYLPKQSYLTCIHYALQYKDWKAMLKADRDTRGAIRYDKDRVQTSGDYDSTSETAIKMIEIERKVEMIDGIITDTVSSEVMQDYLRRSVCYGFTFYQLQDQGIPCGKNTFSRLRQKFYYNLCQKI